MAVVSDGDDDDEVLPLPLLILLVFRINCLSYSAVPVTNSAAIWSRPNTSPSSDDRSLLARPSFAIAEAAPERTSRLSQASKVSMQPFSTMVVSKGRPFSTDAAAEPEVYMIDINPSTIDNQVDEEVSFTSDCSVCNAQISDLKEFQVNFSDQVDVISIGGYSLGGNVDDISAIEDFALEHNVSWPYVLDEEGTMMAKFGLESRYPSWVLLEGNLSSGLPQVVDTFVGRESYDDLVHRIDNRSSPINVSEQLVEILDYFGHWKQDHVSDTDMLSIISDLLGYEFESETVEEVANYGVSHSNKLYLIDKEGNVRVVWRGIDWTYASVYHDIQLLML